MSRASRNNWLAALSSGATGFMGGLAAGQKARREERAADLDEKKLQELILESKRKEGEGGYRRGATGLEADPDYYTEGTPAYQRATREAALKAMSSPRSAIAGALFTVADVFAIRGEPVPDVLKGKENLPFDHRYNSLFPAKAKAQPEMNFGDIQGIIQGTADPTTRVPAPFAGIARPANRTNSQQLMSPEQQAQYEQTMRLPQGSARGMTVGQFGAGISGVRAQEAAGGRQDKSLSQSWAQHEDTKNLQRETAVKDSVAEMNNRLAELSRLGAHIDEASVINPSMSDYQILRGKFGAQSLLGGMNPVSPSKEDEKRYSFYNSLGQDYVRNLFSSGGKALTASEERLAGSLAVKPGSTLPDIRSKARGIRDYMRSKVKADLESMERINPKAANELRAKYSTVMADLDRRLQNASDLRARGGRTVNEPLSQEAVKSGKKLGISEQKLKDIRQYPTDMSGGGGLKKGDVMDGYRFQGGDPGDQKNWKKVK